MEKSHFILSTELNDQKRLLYSTLTTAFIAVNKKDYNKIFIENDFSDKILVDHLYKLGFLVESYKKELDTLDNIYNNEIDSRIPVVKIFSTNKCNARCYYCFEEVIEPLDMSYETAEQTSRFIEKFYPQKHIQINWFGGEPLLNFDVIRQITLNLIDNGFVLKTHITTNGSLITQDKIDFFKKYYETVSIQVTIDDIGDSYSKVKRYIDIPEDEAFSKVIKNTHLLLDNDNISTRIRINFLKSKIDNAMNVFDFLREKFKDYKSLVIYLAPLTFDEKKPFDTESEHTHLKLMKFYTDKNVIFDNNDKEKSLLSSLSLKPKAIPCGACRTNNLTITANGNIFKCHRIAKYNKYVIGDVWNGIEKNSPCLDIFNNNKTESNGKECRSCKVYPICRGGCKVVLDILQQKENTCKIYNKHEDLIKLYYNKLMNEESYCQ